MKNLSACFISIAVLGLPLPGRAADGPQAPATPGSKSSVGPAIADQATSGVRKRVKPLEKETVPFLGVETSAASATLAAQLDLPPGTGLVVNTVIPDSPAAGVLRSHDILLKLDDQILIEQRQLAVLLRHRKEGDEVTLTFLRAGKRETAKVKLAVHEVPKGGEIFSVPFPPHDVLGFTFRRSADAGGEVPDPAAPRSAEEVDHLLRLIQRGPGAPDAPPGMVAPPTRIFIDRAEGPGFRAMTVNPGNSNLVFSDEAGSLELTIKQGRKTLVAKDPKGETLFSGAVSTTEERAAVPEEIRTRLEQLEGMHDVSFKTDAQFQGAKTKTIRALGRPIAWPHAPRTPASPPASL